MAKAPAYLHFQLLQRPRRFSIHAPMKLLFVPIGSKGIEPEPEKS